METNQFTFRRYLPASGLLLTAAYLALFKGALRVEASSSSAAVRLAYAVTAFLCATLGLLLLRVAFLPISRLHTPLSALLHYLLVIQLYGIESLAKRDLEKATRNVRTTQEKLLMQFLSLNKNTEFGRKMNFASIKDRNDYRQKVPLTNYDTYREYIQRIEKGENNLLTKAQVIGLSLSSGTTGKCKHLPFVKATLIEFMWGLLFPFMYRMSKSSKQRLAPLKMFELRFTPKWQYSESGLPIGPVSAATGKTPFYIAVGRVTPPEAQTEMPEIAQTYIHFYYALYDRELRWFGSTFGGTLLTGLEFLRKNWQILADDIRHGRITNYQQAIPPDVYYQKIKPLKPDPHRAEEIEDAFAPGINGVIKRLWPRIENIWCVVTGSHAVFRDRIKLFAGPSIEIISCVYGASEAVIGVCLNETQDHNGSYTIVPTWSFFEFIPENEIKSKSPTTLFLDELQIGKRYEIIATSPQGFYRYRLGDIVKIVDFYNESPVLDFCSRVGGILDLRGEKTTEDMVLAALQKTKWPNSRLLAEFTTTDCLSLANACTDFEKEDGLYYILFVEIHGLARPLNNDDKIAAFDTALSEISDLYRLFRVEGAIKEPKIFTVPSGTFEQLKRYILQLNGAISNQYKTPHYTSNGDILRFMFKAVYRN